MVRSRKNPVTLLYCGRLARGTTAMCGRRGSFSGKPPKINLMAYKVGQNGEPDGTFP